MRYPAKLWILFTCGGIVRGLLAIPICNFRIKITVCLIVHHTKYQIFSANFSLTRVEGEMSLILCQ